MVPKVVLAELEGAKSYYKFRGRCLYCDIIEQERQDKLAEQERKAQAEADARRTEEAVAAAEMRWKADQAARAAAERRRQEAVEARQRAAEERQAEEKRLALVREKSCIIKPAMSDAEIAHCKWAWSFPPPAP